MKRLLIFVLCAALLSALGGFLISCEKGGEETVPPTAEPELTEAPEPPLQISADALADFVIVRSDVDYLYTAAAKRLEAAFISELSVDHDLKSDFVNDKIPGYEEAEFEILVGPCDRDESRAFLAELGYRDYGYAMDGTKLIISGATPDGTMKAVEHFIGQVLTNAAHGEVFFDNDSQSYLFCDEYPEVSINGVPISEYSIVYPLSKKLWEDNIAKMTSVALAEMSGCELEIKRDTAESTGREIRIGVTSRDTAPSLAEGEFFIGNSGDGILIAASDTADLMAACDTFLEMLEASPELTLKDTVASREAGEEILLLSYNVWMHTAGQESRVESVLKTIEGIAPDIMGLQECTHEWMAFLTERFSADYDYVGEGRDGTLTSQDQFNPIFYRKDKFTLVEGGTRWLSDTPEVKYTKVSASQYERIFTYAVLEEKATGECFVFINTHFDHVGGQGDQASCMAAYISRFYDMPMFMSGDYNSSGMATKLSNFGYINSRYAAQTKVEQGATHTNGNEIDYIFTNGRGAIVTHYEVMNDNGSSDHYPVIAKIRFLK